MYNKNIPSNLDIPSTGKLIKSTVLAAITAGALLVTVVLPAEYGIDPTGIGNAIGLKKMGEIKVSLAEEAAVERALERAKQSAAAVDVQEVTVKQKQDEMNIVSKAEADPPAANLLNHEMQVTLAPNEGTEIKVKMDKGKQVNYTWWTDGGRANFDIHGDSKELNIDYHNYSKGSQQKSEGVLVAAFDGNHGWFWRNRTPETITVTLQTNGEYTNIKHIE